MRIRFGGLLMSRSVNHSWFGRITTGISEPEQLTQRKSKWLIEGFVCSTPNMGVILWGASPLYLVPETFTRSQYNK